MSDQPASRGVSDYTCRALFDTAPQAVVIIDPAGAVHYVNRSACILVGRRAAELEGQPYCSHLWWTHEGALMRARDAIMRAAGGEVVRIETTRGNVSERHFELTVRPIANDKGDAVALIAEEREAPECPQTERVATELRTILDMVAAGICLIKEDRIEWGNPALSVMLGCTPEELKGEIASSFYAGPEDFERFVRKAAESIGSGRVYAAEVLCRRKPSSEFWCHASGRAIDPRQLELGTIWAIQDVTARREAEQALRLSEARLDAAQVQSRTGSWEVGAGWARPYWSKEMFRLFDLDPDSMAPAFEASLQMAHPDDRAALEQLKQQVMATGTDGRVVFRRNPSLGPNCVFEGDVRAQRDAEGRVVGASGTLQDITARHHTEESLRRSQARLEAAQAQAHIGSWEVDLKTREMVCSKELVRLLGFDWQASPPLPMAMRELIHPEDRQTVIATYQFVLQSGEPGSCEFRGSLELLPGRFFLMTFEFGRDSFGQPLHVSGTLQDITERKRAEAERARLQDQLQQATKMEAVGRLAGGVAHDFNNLLTVISGNIELTRLDLDPSDPMSQNLDEVAKAASSAAQLTRQLLAFSRRQIVEPRVLNINDLLESLRKMLGRLIGEHIGLETSLARDLRSVKVDPGQFDQVVVNLVVNARDAMPDGGRLLIETSNLEVDEAICRLHPGLEPGSFVLFAVSDTGRGMTDEVKNRLFEPFFTTKAEGRGTGLGLAMIFGVVKQAGGAIDVYSEVGHGTTFKIFLPSVDAPNQGTISAPVAPRIMGGRETILLIEDEGSVRELCASFLVRQGYTVLIAANPDQALACANARAEAIDLLLTDVVLPGINGRELADRILLSHPEMVVLFTSGYTQDSIIRHGVLTDRVHFISKPYSLHGIASKVRHVLDMRAVRVGAPGPSISSEP